jgi:hypothetical protein
MQAEQEYPAGGLVAPNMTQQDLHGPKKASSTKKKAASVAE